VPSAKVGIALDALSGNFTKREEFEGKLGPEWLQVHVPRETWFSLRDGALQIRALQGQLSEKRNVSFLARRQQHQKFEVSTQFTPSAQAKVAAGLAAFQNENYWYAFGMEQTSGGPVVFLERRAGEHSESMAKVLPAVPQSLRLKISGDGGKYSFYYDAGQGWQALRENDDGSILSTEVAGGFVGTVLGPFARQD
jgi:alpha-N-arabinofuranosidase